MTSISLPNITLVTISSVNITGHLKALQYSSRYINFGEVLLLSDTDNDESSLYGSHIKHKKINKLSSKSDYSKFVVYELYKYINTEFCLIIQADGFVINPHLWQNQFLQYDYIGAPWPDFYKDFDGNNIRVGNGGFSLRSKKLLEVPLHENFELHWDALTQDSEDTNICAWRKDYYLRQGIKFAPLDVAKYFAHENYSLVSEVHGIQPFGFHTCYGYINEDPKKRVHYPTFK